MFAERSYGVQIYEGFQVLYYRPDRPFQETPVCFHLVFATNHEQGLFEMNDAMAEALEEFYPEIHGGTLFPTFATEVDAPPGVHGNYGKVWKSVVKILP